MYSPADYSFTINLHINYMYGYVKHKKKASTTVKAFMEWEEPEDIMQYRICVQINDIDLRNVDNIKYWMKIVECLNRPNDIRFCIDDISRSYTTSMILIALTVNDWKTVVAIDKMYPIKEIHLSDPMEGSSDMPISSNQLRQLNNISIINCYSNNQVLPLSWKPCEEGKVKKIVSSSVKKFPTLKDLSARLVVISLSNTAVLDDDYAYDYQQILNFLKKKSKKITFSF